MMTSRSTRKPTAPAALRHYPHTRSDVTNPLDQVAKKDGAGTAPPGRRYGSETSRTASTSTNRPRSSAGSQKEILVQADQKARKLGLDRRDFLASAMGMATSLSVLNLAAGCSSDGSDKKGTGLGGKDGGYELPPDATMNCAAAEDVLGSQGEFIFDIQTHHIEHEGEWRTTNPGSGQGLASFFAPLSNCVDTILTAASTPRRTCTRSSSRATRRSPCSLASPRRSARTT